MSRITKRKLFVVSILVTIVTLSSNLMPDKNGRNYDLSLEDVLIRVISKNPDLITIKYDIKSKDGLIYQQSRLPNPEFEFELENFAGSGEFKGFGLSEITAVISQDIPIGSKRSLSVDIASEEKNHSKLLLKKKIADLILEAKIKFYELYSLQQLIKLKRKRVARIKEFEVQIQKRVRAGRTSPSELSLIKIYLLRCETDLNSAESEFRSTGIHLSSLWGEKEFKYRNITSKNIVWDKEIISHPQNELLKVNPDLAILRNEIKIFKINLKLQKSLKLPDITVTGGIKRHSETGEKAFTAGFSIPIPLFNTNKGGISSAGYSYDKANAEFKAEELKIYAELKEKTGKLKAGLVKMKTFRIKIIPEINRAEKIVSEGYISGRSDYLEVISVNESVYEINEEYINAIRDCSITLAEIDRLNGRISKNITKGSKND